MPELLILTFTLFFVGSIVVLCFERSNPAATATGVLSFVALLYAIGKHIEHRRPDVREPQTASAPDRSLSVSNDSERIGRTNENAVATGGPTAQQRNEADITSSLLPLPMSGRLNGLGGTPPAVTVSVFAKFKPSSKFMDVSGIVTNSNEFPVKNVVVTCGDASYGGGDVSAMIETVVPARSSTEIAALRMGPIKATLPPAICIVAKYDRAE